jgi:hypothetical protein
MTSDEEKRFTLFADLFDGYLSDIDAIFASFSDYQVVLSELFRLWTLRFVAGDAFFHVKEAKKRFGDVCPLMNDLDVSRKRIDSVFKIKGDNGDVRFSGDDIARISEFIKGSGHTFSVLSDVTSAMDVFAESARFCSDCDISMTAHRFVYFDKLIVFTLNNAAKRLSNVNDLISAVSSDMQRQDKRISGSSIMDEASIERRKAEIEQRVRDIGKKKEVPETRVASDIITITFPGDLFESNLGTNNKFYALPVGEDDFVFIPKKRVRPARDGSGDSVIACKREDLDVTGFRTLSGRMVTFDELRMIVLRALDDRRFF